MIIQRSKRVYEFLIKDFGYSSANVILFGRSLGSGPAIQTAANENPSLLILMSAYTKIKNVAGDLCRCAKWFIKERFNSISYIKKINCPFILIHGINDQVIKWTHSQKLYEEASKLEMQDQCHVSIRADMDHNTFNFVHDIAEPVKEFLKSKLNYITL